MSSNFKKIVATTTASLCMLVLTQVSTAQSGNRSSGFQTQQIIPSQAVQQSYGQTYQPQQSYAQPYQAQPTQQRQVAHVGFDQYDHRGFDSLLQKYVDQRGNVDYVTWQSNSQDRSILLNYLLGMKSVDTSLQASRQSEMAFWINAYNALTLEGILQLYPTKSIKDHAPDASGYNIWDDFKLPVGGQEYSLNDIEHKVLRKMGDPRIHFAIVCASKGCPQLAQRAYFAESLDQQLSNSARLFFQTPEKFSYDLQRGQLGLSPIIQWFGEDFGRTDGERLQYLSQFMPAGAAQLAASGSATITYLDYDWGLNLAPVGSVVPVQSFRPQGTVTGQVLPAQNPVQQGSATRQVLPAQNPVQQGSATRGQVGTYPPIQPQRTCTQGW